MWYHRVIGKSVVPSWTPGGRPRPAASHHPLPGAHTLKPGSASRPFFGVEPVILRDDGKEVRPNEGGKLCIKKPWPGMMRTTWGDHNRFIETYFTMYPNIYFTGDGCRWTRTAITG
jgi:acetyl-CoA synthetase